MKDVFVSVRGRILVNVEALNMTESVGNYVKHRRVPVMVQEEKGSAVYFVPAISGESVAHGFQKVLAEEASKRGLPVCVFCKQGIFLKSTNDKVLKAAFGGTVSQENLEEYVVGKCVVEDVGGFLYAEKEKNAKRTSNFYVGYMIPAKEALINTVVESQLHTRYALGTPFVQKDERGQAIYYVELSSSLYTFSFDLDTRYIGRLTFNYVDAGRSVVGDDERLKRVEATLDALKTFLVELAFGAKKTRFLPTVEWDSLVVAVSDDVWTASSPFSANYIDNTQKKKEKISYNTELFVYRNGAGSLEGTVIDAVEEAKARLKS